MAPAFFSAEWATAVGDALQAGPDAAAREGKLPEYWDFYQAVRDNYVGSWALGVRGRDTYLRVEWAKGQVTESRVVGPGEPVAATYVLEGEYADWQALFEGYDALRTVMYRKLILREGPLLEFFKTIYFFVECLAVVGTVETGFGTE